MTTRLDDTGPPSRSQPPAAPVLDEIARTIIGERLPGCGIGGLALPLTGYLTRGRYHGIDIVPRGIDGCRTHITPRHPHFQCALADDHNARSHPKGKGKAAEYRFPFADTSVDFVLLTSVFTHLLPADAEHDLMEGDGCSGAAGTPASPRSLASAVRS